VPEADGTNAGFVPSRLRGVDLVTAKSVTAAAVTDSGASTPALTDTDTETDEQQQQQQVLPGNESDAPEGPTAPAARTEVILLLLQLCTCSEIK
jgi:hypothetical protein